MQFENICVWRKLTFGWPAHIIGADDAFDIGVFGVGANFLIQNLKKSYEIFAQGILRLYHQSCFEDLWGQFYAALFPLLRKLVNYN